MRLKSVMDKSNYEEDHNYFNYNHFASLNHLTHVEVNKKQKKRIASYGAPAKGNTLLNYYKIGPRTLEFALEDLPSKQGLYTPGMHIPVVDSKYAHENEPDYYLMLAWNYKKAILEKEKKFRKKGKFIIPVGDKIEIL